MRATTIVSILGPGLTLSADRRRATSDGRSPITWPRHENSARSDLLTPAIVLDASAVEVALWTDGGSRLARHVLEADEIIAPDHFQFECASALRRMELRDELSAAEAQETLEQLLALRVRRIDTTPLFSEAWTMRRNVTVADALYVVIARRSMLRL